jgi:hypothetical protein
VTHIATVTMPPNKMTTDLIYMFYFVSLITFTCTLAFCDFCTFLSKDLFISDAVSRLDSFFPSSVEAVAALDAADSTSVRFDNVMGISGPGVVSAVNVDSVTVAAAIFLESIGLEVVSIRVTGGRAA